MTPLFPAQRAAEEFDQVLAGTADPAVVARYAELLDSVEQLRAVPEVTPRAEFVGDLRSRLMTAAEAEFVRTPVKVTPLPEARTRRRNRRLGTLAASLVVVGGSAGMAAAASGALPGETLYPIKRGIEQVTTAVRFDGASQGKALLDQAANRLEEVRALQAKPTADPDLIASALADFREAADSGSKKLFDNYSTSGDQGDITTVRDFTSAQMVDVADMSSIADTATNDLLLDAADTLADIDEQARGLCGDCDPAKPLTPPEALSAGAGAATISTLIARPIQQAQSDIDVLTARKIAALKHGAEESAAEIPKLPTGGTSGVTPTNPFDTTPSDPGAPLRSTIMPDGKLLPSVTTGAAVTDLVTGVTGALDQAAGGATAPVTKPLDDTVKNLGDALGDTTDQLLP